MGMTNEFAIKVLTELRGYGDKFANIGYDRKEALELAIKTLEQQPCEDCISREQAIRATYGFERYTGIDEAPYEYAESILRDLPSVTPSISDVENDFNLGYNCGYADAMIDIAEGSESE